MHTRHATLTDWNDGAELSVTATVRTVNDETVTVLRFGHSFSMTLDDSNVDDFVRLVEYMANEARTVVRQGHEATQRALAERSVL